MADDLAKKVAEIWRRMPPSGSDLAKVPEKEKQAVRDLIALVGGGNG